MNAVISRAAVCTRTFRAEQLLRKAAEHMTAEIEDLVHDFCVTRDGVPDETTMAPDEAKLIRAMRSDLAEIEAFLEEPDQGPEPDEDEA